ncbi:TetR/AcrR family transcriptional regulator [Poseidonocella sp. HB161398]|uniref:TetR/AcrR family transcriptional regulator n=1 Tax=Poseidonocella sp. HB161398 TaxID=2320855 RepID=UPI00110966E5|nr:TetR/AcrR family transcriptional regulator [Poseidonocella sp. HB161398]
MTEPSPPDPRRAALMSAAADLFFERGYAATSIDAIIDRAGGSKRTIYALFGSKEGLFEALVRENTERMFGAALFGGEELSLEATLRDFATHLLELFTNERTVGLYQVVVAEAGRLPELAASFYRLGPERGRAWIAQVLERAAARGEILPCEPDLAAGQFLGLVRSDVYYEIVLGLRGPLSDAEIRHIADAAVDTFLDGMRPRG